MAEERLCLRQSEEAQGNGASEDPYGPSSSSSQKRPSHGNFSRYYSIRRDPASSSSASRAHQNWAGGQGSASASQEQLDPRVEALRSWWDESRGKGVIQIQGERTSLCRRIDRVLDVGCNSGKVSLDLARSMLASPPSLICGVDVDAALIRAARAGARSMANGHREKASLAPPLKKRKGLGSSIEVEEGDGEMGGETSRTEILFGALDWSKPPPDVAVDTEEQRILDEDEEGWDLIMVLSVTKWIHIHNSDSGILTFFSRLARSLKPGGVMLLEAQPWKSYEQARRVLSPELRSRQRGLRLQPETDFEFVLTEMLGLRGPVELGESRGFGFKRPLHLYFQPPLSELSPTALQARRHFAAALSPETSVDPIEIPSLTWVPRNFKERRK